MKSRGKEARVGDQRLFDVAAATQYLGCCRNTLIERVENHEIEAVMQDGRRWFKLEELNRYIDSLEPWIPKKERFRNNDRTH